MLKWTLLLDFVTCVEVHVVEIFAALLLLSSLLELQVVLLVFFIVLKV